MLRCDPAHPVAAEAMQSVFLRILESGHAALAEIQDVRAWLAAGVRNATLNTIRSGRRAEALRLRLSNEPEPVDVPAALDDRLRSSLDRLPDELRELIVLKHIAGLSLDQIALSLAVNRNTIASRLRVAMERLREVLDVPSQPQGPGRDSPRVRSEANP